MDKVKELFNHYESLQIENKNHTPQKALYNMALNTLKLIRDNKVFKSSDACYQYTILAFRALLSLVFLEQSRDLNHISAFGKVMEGLAECIHQLKNRWSKDTLGFHPELFVCFISVSK